MPLRPLPSTVEDIQSFICRRLGNAYGQAEDRGSAGSPGKGKWCCHLLGTLELGDHGRACLSMASGHLLFSISLLLPSTFCKHQGQLSGTCWCLSVMFWQQHPGQFLLLVSAAQVPYPARGWGRAGSRAGGIRGISHAWLGVSDGSLQKNMCSSDLSPQDWQGLVSSLDSRPGDTQGAPEEASKVVRCLLGMCLSSVRSWPMSL